MMDTPCTWFPHEPHWDNYGSCPGLDFTTYVRSFHRVPLSAADQAISDAAEEHRQLHQHTVYVQLGHGWCCAVCDADIVLDFLSGKDA